MNSKLKLTFSQTFRVGECDPDLLGELLRGYVFKPKKDKYGCFDTFAVRHCTPLESTKVFTDAEDVWTRYQFKHNKISIEVRWFWVNDEYCNQGTLEFLFPDGNILSNSDCKHPDE